MGCEDFENGRRYERIRDSLLSQSRRVMTDELFSAAQMQSQYILFNVSLAELQKLARQYYPKGDSMFQATYSTGKAALKRLEDKFTPEGLAEARAEARRYRDLAESSG